MEDNMCIFTVNVDIIVMGIFLKGQTINLF